MIEYNQFLDYRQQKILNKYRTAMRTERKGLHIPTNQSVFVVSKLDCPTSIGGSYPCIHYSSFCCDRMKIENHCTLGV